MSRPIEPPHTLELGVLSLAALSTDDVDDIFTHFADHEVAKYLDFPPLQSHDEAVEIIEWARGILEHGHGVRYAIRDAQGTFLGTAGFNKIISHQASRAEIAYDLARHAWGRGLMTTTIMPALLDLGFSGWHLHRIEALVTPGNERSAKLLTRLAFKHEGTLRGYGRWDGADHDQDMYALLGPEWAARSSR